MLKEYNSIKHNYVYKLKKCIKVWCVDIQESIIINTDERDRYVEITHTVFDNKTLFGNLLEPNSSGCLRKCEIEFSIDDIHLNNPISNVEEFNMFFMIKLRDFLDLDYVVDR